MSSRALMSFKQKLWYNLGNCEELKIVCPCFVYFFLYCFSPNKFRSHVSYCFLHVYQIFNNSKHVDYIRYADRWVFLAVYWYLSNYKFHGNTLMYLILYSKPLRRENSSNLILNFDIVCSHDKHECYIKFWN
jgi:hypothetical protein